MRYIVALIINMTFFTAFAANEMVRKDSLQTIVITFDDDKAVTSQKIVKNGKTVKKKRIFPKNNIKIGLFGPAYGEVPFYYERYIADWFTLQGGIGITTRDFLGDIYRQITFGSKYSRSQYSNSTWTGVNEFDEYDSYNSFQYRKSGVGVCVSVAPRFFPGGDAFDGWYLSPVFEYAIRNYKVQNVDEDGIRIKTNYTKEKISSIYFLLDWGWQRNFEPVILDFSFSTGFTKNNYIRQDIGYTYDGAATVYGNRTISFASLSPYFKLNLNLGLVFGQKAKPKQ
jgi:hypothetical protein